VSPTKTPIDDAASEQALTTPTLLVGSQGEPGRGTGNKEENEDRPRKTARQPWSNTPAAQLHHDAIYNSIG